MKKLCLITLLMCFIATCTACGNKESQIASTEKNAEENASEEESKEAQDTEKVQEDSSSESNEDAQEDTQNEAKAPVEAVEKPQVLSLQETRNAKYEGINDFEKFLMISKFNYVSFWEGKEAYPQMERTLSEMAGMITRTQEDEADNIISFAEEMFDIAGGNFETQISTSDVQIRRADSVAVSYLTDSYANYGFIEDFRGMWGSNYDTQTGEELLLNDVIKDMTEVPVLVTKELNSHLGQERVTKKLLLRTTLEIHRSMESAGRWITMESLFILAMEILLSRETEDRQRLFLLQNIRNYLKRNI